MIVRVRFFGPIQEFMNKKWMVINAPEDLTVGDVIHEIACQSNPKLLDKVFDENSQVRPEIIVLLNGRSIQNLSGLKTRVENNDVLSIFPVAAGGR